MQSALKIAVGFVRGHRDGIRQIVLVVLAGLVYFGIRNLTVGSAAAAYANAARLYRFERGVHLAWEASLQAPVVARPVLVALVNWIYVWGHWPVIMVVAILLFRYRRDRYLLLRNSMFVSGAIGFLCFALLPVAPPRLADPGLVDTVTLHSHAYRALQPPGLTNQFAAFPSLHFGWNFLAGIAVWGATTNIVLRALSVAGPAAMAAAVVVSANHYTVDVIGGLAVVLVGLAVHEVARSPRVHSKVDAVSHSSSRRQRPAAAPTGRRPWFRRCRGRRSTVARPPRGAPPEDGRPDSDPLGPLGACQPVRTSAQPGPAARGDRAPN